MIGRVIFVSIPTRPPPRHELPRSADSVGVCTAGNSKVWSPFHQGKAGRADGAGPMAQDRFEQEASPHSGAECCAARATYAPAVVSRGQGDAHRRGVLRAPSSRSDTRPGGRASPSPSSDVLVVLPVLAVSTSFTSQYVHACTTRPSC